MCCNAVVLLYLALPLPSSSVPQKFIIRQLSWKLMWVHHTIRNICTHYLRPRFTFAKMAKIYHSVIGLKVAPTQLFASEISYVTWNWLPLSHNWKKNTKDNHLTAEILRSKALWKEAGMGKLSNYAQPARGVWPSFLIPRRDPRRALSVPRNAGKTPSISCIPLVSRY